MRRRVSAAIVLGLLMGTLTASVSLAKEILRVYISGGLLQEAVLISDVHDLAVFRAHSPVMGNTPDPPVELIDDPQIGFPVAYELRLVLAGSAPDVVMTYYPDPEGERGYIYLDDSHFRGSPFWWRVDPEFDTLMAKYGAVLPATLPETGGPPSASPVPILAVLGLTAVALGWRLRRATGSH